MLKTKPACLLVTRRLVEKASEGREQVPGYQETSSQWNGNIEVLRGIEAKTHFILWRSYRLFPLMWSFLGSVLVVLIFLGVLEITDTSFKSEREVARYLGLPILGSLPKLSEYSNTLDGKHGFS
ncbi:MAG: hypothetical protein ACE5KZ_10295 [Candidatus Scalinduaceae bacterium]